jgi:SNF2 family DNA or RNA helicase
VRVSPTCSIFGSRVGAACKLVHSFVEKGEGVLVFTQFRALLANMNAALISMGVRASVLEGSTARRASCARRFRERDVDVLLLCFERSISGLNLSEARHVVFLHPLVGQAHEVAAMEEQAVGRAHRRCQLQQVTVHHMIGEDTDEEAIWKERHGGEATISTGLLQN